MKVSALAISVLFHPLLLISLGAFLIFELDRVYHVALDPRATLTYLAVILIGTFAFPINAILLVRKMGRQGQDMFMEKREDRTLPLLIATLFVLLTFYVFQYQIGYKTPHLLRGFLLGSSASILVASVINRWYKISLHAMGLGGILGLLVFMQGAAILDLRFLIGAWLLLSGLVCSARIFLGSHSPFQIYSGYLTGFLIIFLIVRL